MADGLDKFLGIPTSQKVVVLVVLMGLIGAGWYFLYFDEVQGRIVQENQRTPTLTQELAAETEVEKNLAVYQEEIERLRKMRDDMRDRLPDDAGIADLLEKIHGQARIVGLEIARFERADTVDEAMYARIPVKMVLRGTFAEISTFFFYLGKLTRIVNVENIELVADRSASREKSAGRERTRLTASCNATTFMYLAPGEAAQ